MRAWSWGCGLRQPLASSYPWTGSGKPPSPHHCHQLQRQVSENRVPLWADDGTGAFSTWVICPCVTGSGIDQWGPKVRPHCSCRWTCRETTPQAPCAGPSGNALAPLPLRGLTAPPHACWASHPEDPWLPAYWGWGELTNLVVNRSPTRGQWGPVAAQPPSAAAPLAHSKLTQYVCAGFLQLQNNLSQTWWLQVTASYCPSALEARSPPSRYLQAHMSPEASRGAFIPCLSHFFFFLQDHVYFILFSLKKKTKTFYWEIITES